MSGCNTLNTPKSWMPKVTRGNPDPVTLDVLLNSTNEEDRAPIKLLLANLVHDFEHDFSLDSVGAGRLTDIGGNILETVESMHVLVKDKTWVPVGGAKAVQHGGDGGGIDADKINTAVRDAMSRIYTLNRQQSDDSDSNLFIAKMFQHLTGDTPYISGDATDTARMEFDTADQLYTNLQQTISDYEETVALLRKGFYVFTDPQDIAAEEKWTQLRLEIKQLEKSIEDYQQAPAGSTRTNPYNEKWMGDLRELKAQAATWNRKRRMKRTALRDQITQSLPPLKRQVDDLRTNWLHKVGQMLGIQPLGSGAGGGGGAAEDTAAQEGIYEYYQNITVLDSIREAIDTFTTDTLITTSGYLMDDAYLLGILKEIADTNILAAAGAECTLGPNRLAQWTLPSGRAVDLSSGEYVADQTGIINRMLIEMGVLGFLGDSMRTRFIPQAGGGNGTGSGEVMGAPGAQPGPGQGPAEQAAAEQESDTGRQTGVSPDSQSVEAQEDETVAKEDATVAKEDITVAKEDTTVAREDTTVAKEDTTVAKEDATVVQEDGTEAKEDEGSVEAAVAAALSVPQLHMDAGKEVEMIENALLMAIYKLEGDPARAEAHGLFTVMLAAFSALNTLDGTSPISTLLINGQIRSFMKLWIVYCPWMKALVRPIVSNKF